MMTYDERAAGSAGQTPAAPGGAEVPFQNEDRIGGPPQESEERTFGGVNGGPVLDHVQRFADAVCGATGACVISTYEGHHPDRTRALDILVSSGYGAFPSSFTLGDSVAAFTLNNFSAFNVMYVIWRQRINSNDGRGWRQMEDRGSITQNHFDHCHVSFGEGEGRRPVISEGDSGSAVTHLQQRLNHHGFPVDVDGIFGPQTHQAVVAFQSSRGLDPDGIVGPLTWAKLDA